MLSLKYVLTGLAALSASVMAAPAPKITDTTILNYALTLEYLEKAFYAEALAKFDDAAFAAEGFEPWVRQQIVETAQQEATHVAVLQSVLGKKATKACTYNFPYTTVTEFLDLSAVIEGVGVSAYAGAAPLVSSKTVLEYSAQILPVEARHQALVSRALGQDGSPASFDTPLGLSEVYTLAAPFFVSCPKSNPALPVMLFPSFSYSGDFASGNTLTVTLPKHKKCDKEQFYLYILNGLDQIAVPIGKDGRVKIPAGSPIGFEGRVYLLITNSKGPICDKNVVAGPLFTTLPSLAA